MSDVAGKRVLVTGAARGIGAALAERLASRGARLAPAAAVRERIGRWSAVEEAGAARCRVRMTTDSLDWPAMALGAVGADFQVISPPALRDHVRDWGRRFSQAAAAS